ncbi:MAG: periplasmic heavy metal sensor [Gemmataceae bacterium]
MWTNRHAKLTRAALVAGILLLGGLLAWPIARAAQSTPSSAGNPPDTSDKDLAGQLRDLRAKVASLEAALKQQVPGKPVGMSGTGGGMAGMGHMGMMGSMGGDGMSGMSGMPGMSGMGTMDMDKMEMMGMMGMAGKGMPGMGKMQQAAALPGFPGASHIYHVGATGFFLDHPEHVKLTDKQKGDLGQVKEKALLAKASAQRKIDEAEQELWALTASDRPDADKIEAKVRQIEKLRGDQRLAFIRAVGEAAKVLTEEQRRAVLGGIADTTDKAKSHKNH